MPKRIRMFIALLVVAGVCAWMVIADFDAFGPIPALCFAWWVGSVLIVSSSEGVRAPQVVLAVVGLLVAAATVLYYNLTDPKDVIGSAAMMAEAFMFFEQISLRAAGDRRLGIETQK